MKKILSAMFAVSALSLLIAHAQSVGTFHPVSSDSTLTIKNAQDQTAGIFNFVSPTWRVQATNNAAPLLNGISYKVCQGPTQIGTYLHSGGNPLTGSPVPGTFTPAP